MAASKVKRAKRVRPSRSVAPEKKTTTKKTSKRKRVVLARWRQPPEPIKVPDNPRMFEGGIDFIVGDVERVGEGSARGRGELWRGVVIARPHVAVAENGPPVPSTFVGTFVGTTVYYDAPQISVRMEHDGELYDCVHPFGCFIFSARPRKRR